MSRHEYSQVGVHTRIQGKQPQPEADALGTASPGTHSEAAQNQRPHRGKQGPRSPSPVNLLWAAAPTPGCLGAVLLCLSISSGCRHGEFCLFCLFLFSYQRQLTSRRNQASATQNQLIWRLFFLEKYQRISTLLLFKSRTISGANSLKKCPQLYMKLFIKGKALYRCEQFFSSRGTAHLNQGRRTKGGGEREGNP